MSTSCECKCEVFASFRMCAGKIEIDCQQWIMYKRYTFIVLDLVVVVNISIVIGFIYSIQIRMCDVLFHSSLPFDNIFFGFDWSSFVCINEWKKAKSPEFRTQTCAPALHLWFQAGIWMKQHQKHLNDLKLLIWFLNVWFCQISMTKSKRRFSRQCFLLSFQ